jgi:outer membrane protein assembly factor BamB
MIPTPFAPVAVTDYGILGRWLEIGGRFRTRIALVDESGEELWCEERGGEERFQWTCPVANESLLAAYGKVVECRSVKDGSLRWNQSMATHGGIARPWGATVADGVLVLLAETGTVGLDAEDGHLLWSYPSVARAALSKGFAFLGGHRSLVAMNARTGEGVWSRDIFLEMRKVLPRGPLYSPATAPAVSSDLVFVVDQSGRVWTFDRHTGEVLDAKRHRGIGVISGSPLVVVGDRLYVNDLSIDEAAPSALHCFRVAEKDHPAGRVRSRGLR